MFQSRGSVVVFAECQRDRASGGDWRGVTAGDRGELARPIHDAPLWWWAPILLTISKQLLNLHLRGSGVSMERSICKNR